MARSNRNTISTSGEVWMIVKDHRKLARIMAINEVSYRDLARLVGWKSHSYVGRICRGEIRSIDPEAALKIAIYLDVPVDDLFLPRASNISARTVRESQTTAA